MITLCCLLCFRNCCWVLCEILHHVDQLHCFFLFVPLRYKQLHQLKLGLLYLGYMRSYECLNVLSILQVFTKPNCVCYNWRVETDRYLRLARQKLLVELILLLYIFLLDHQAEAGKERR